MPARTLVDLLLLGAIWGAAFPFVRVAVPAFGPVALIAVRVAVAALVLVPLAARERGVAQARSVLVPLVWVGALNTAIPFTLFAYAALSLPAGLSSVLNATAPLFGAVVGVVWLGQRPSRLAAIGLTVGFVGVLVLAWPSLTGSREWLAVGAALVAATMYGVAAHMTQRWLGGVRPLVVAAGSQVVAAVLLAPLAVFAWPATPPPSRAWMFAATLGVGCTALAYALYFRLIARAGTSTAITVAYTIPAFGVTWGAMFLGERLAATSIAGGLLVLVGVGFTTWSPRTR